MFLLRLIWMAVNALGTNFLRSMLATLGVMIGVGAVISAVSILQGSQREMMSTLESFGADQIMIINGQAQHGGRAATVNSLTPHDAQVLLKDLPDRVKATSPQYRGAGQIKYFQKNVNAIVLGCNENYSTLYSYHAVSGQFITHENVQSTDMVVCLGHEVAADLFGSLPAKGKSVKINGKSFRVIGVMEEKGSIGFEEVDNQVFIPVTTAMNRMFGANYLNMLVVQAEDAKDIDGTISAVTTTLRDSHNLRAGEENDFQILTQERFKRSLQQFTLIFGVVLYSIAGISMIVGGIGIMNIMMVSVTERTREIGVRIAVGARRSDILVQFLVEASVISMLGGGTGIVCGWALATLISDVTQVIPVYTPPLAIVFALVMAISVGLVSGLYPAIRAAYLDPVEALRYE